MITKSCTFISRIVDSSGTAIPYRVKVSDNFYDNRNKSIELYANDLQIGKMRYTLWSESVYIDRMDNLTLSSKVPLKYVGTLLFEHAFRESMKAGRGGRIELIAVGNAPLTYVKWGFIKKSEPANWMKQCILDYQHANEKDKPLKAEQLSLHPCYAKLLAIASENSDKNPENLCLDEIIAYGQIDPYNQIFKQILEESGKHVDHFQMKNQVKQMTGMMFLPEEKISHFQKQFGFSSLSQTEVSFFHKTTSKAEALSKEPASYSGSHAMRKE